MTYDFIGNLSESNLFPSKNALTRKSAEDMVELLYLYVCAIRILLAEDETESWARPYLRKTIQFDNFDRWRVNGTDLYSILHSIYAPDVVLKHEAESNKYRDNIVIDYDNLYRWMRAGSLNQSRSDVTKRLFTRMDYTFKIKNGSFRAIRRLVMDWPDLGKTDRQLAMTRLLQLLRVRAPRSELLPYLNRIARQHDLELDDVCNPETGEGCQEPMLKKNSKLKTSFLSGLAAVAAGAAASYAISNRKNK